MTSGELGAPRTAWADPPAAVRFALDTTTIAATELRKVVRDPVELISRAAQPVLWLVVFGQVLARTRAIPTGSLPYLDFLAPGVLAQSALFSAIFYGLAVIWERDLGVVQKLLVSPASRAALVSGKAVAGGVRALVQAAIIYLVAAVVGIHLRLEPVAIAGVIVAVAVGSGGFATFSLIVACIARSRERFMGIGQLLTMPVFFASSAVYPLALMPDWLRAIATVNPLTYLVDALRTLMVVGAVSEHGLALDFGVLTVVLVALVAIGARLYPRLA